MFFVIIGLVVVAVVALPTDSDPKRPVDIKSSAPNTVSITLFLGQFGDKGFPFLLEVTNSST